MNLLRLRHVISLQYVLIIGFYWEDKENWNIHNQQFPIHLKRWNIKLKVNKFNFDGSKYFLTNWTVTDESSWTRVVFICFNQKDFASAPCLLCEMFDPRLLLTVIEVQLTLSVGDSLQHSRECPEWPAVEGLLCLMFSVTITTSYNFGGFSSEEETLR